MKTKRELFLSISLIFLLSILTAGCGISSINRPAAGKGWSDERITVGFSQVGSESDWRMASTASVKEAFSTVSGYNLVYNDAQQKQSNQIKAIRQFIDQDVDYILLDPITEHGWDTALQEAKDASIPVIVFDRKVELTDDSLYTAWIGSDFYLEGKRAVEWLRRFLNTKGYLGDVNIVNIQGTLDSTAQIGRSRALEEAVAGNPKWHILDRQSGDFTEARGREVMEDMLLRFSDRINVVYCENDNEAYGAIEALESAGRKIGCDIAAGEVLVLSFDATRKGLEFTQRGLIAVNTECSPLYGPLLTELIGKLERGEALDKETYISEGQFSTQDEVPGIKADGDYYPVTILTKDIMDNRKY
ncbi:MAG: ABC transporter substrate-binding protein [Lachnospiraceae bacterium]|nr:ABC transporter substrate-binding protein [Lachnospiraceae bacterium]